MWRSDHKIARIKVPRQGTGALVRQIQDADLQTGGQQHRKKKAINVLRRHQGHDPAGAVNKAVCNMHIYFSQQVFKRVE